MAVDGILRGLPGMMTSVDLSAHQFLAVQMTPAADFTVEPCVAGATFLGVAYNNPSNVGESTTVMVRGMVKMVAEAALSAGDPVDVGPASGAILAAGADTIGVAVTNAAAAGEIVSVFIG